jgi:hypothetical protein
MDGDYVEHKPDGTELWRRPAPTGTISDSDFVRSVGDFVSAPMPRPVQIVGSTFNGKAAN